MGTALYMSVTMIKHAAEGARSGGRTCDAASLWRIKKGKIILLTRTDFGDKGEGRARRRERPLVCRDDQRGHVPPCIGGSGSSHYSSPPPKARRMKGRPSGHL